MVDLSAYGGHAYISSSLDDGIGRPACGRQAC